MGLVVDVARAEGEERVGGNVCHEPPDRRDRQADQPSPSIDDVLDDRFAA